MCGNNTRNPFFYNLMRLTGNLFLQMLSAWLIIILTGNNNIVYEHIWQHCKNLTAHSRQITDSNKAMSQYTSFWTTLASSLRSLGGTTSTYLHLPWSSGNTSLSRRYDWARRWSDNVDSLVSGTGLGSLCTYQSIMHMCDILSESRSEWGQGGGDRGGVNSPLLAPSMSIILPGVHTMISAPLFSSAIWTRQVHNEFGNTTWSQTALLRLKTQIHKTHLSCHGCTQKYCSVGSPCLFFIYKVSSTV